MRKISLKLIVPLRLRKKLFTFLLALAASVGVSYADPVGLQVTELQIPASWENDQTLVTISDLPGFVAVSFEEAKTWDAAPEGGVILIYTGINNEGVTATYFVDGVWYDMEPFGGFTRALIYEWASNGERSFYTGGGSTPAPSETTVTWTLEDMASMGTQGGYFKAKGITLMAYGVDNGMSGYGSHEGAFFGGPFVFTTSLGKFTKIEVTNSYLYEQPAFSGDDWTLDGTNAVWEGTPAALVSLVSNLGGITQIKFTISPNASTPANSCGDGLTWAVSDGVLTISYDGVGTGSMDNYDDYLSMPWRDETFSSVVLPEGLISIGQNAFAFINTFSEITLPSTLQYILMNAFSGCGLTSVTIPANVKGIGVSAFISSSSLATVTFEPTTPPRVGGNAFENCNSNLIIYYPCESRALYYKDMQADIAYYHDKMNNCPAPASNLHVTELVAPASWKNDQHYLAVTDMSGFAEADSLLATEWEAPTNCNSVLIYHVTEQYGDYRMYYHYFYSGNFIESQDGLYYLSTIYSNPNIGIKTFYTSSAGGSTTPEIKLNANFGSTYDFADTEAFTDNGDGTATLSNIALTAGYYYNFRVKVDGVSMSDNHEFTRQNPSCVISSGSGDVYYFQADVTGNYSFTWTYESNTLTIGYPAPAVDPAVQNVIDLINAIPNPVVYNQECFNAINAVYDAYVALSEEQRDQVTNYDDYLDAESTYYMLADVNYVIEKINEIGDVEFTSACKHRIDYARSEYCSLNLEAKGYVTNYNTLLAAEAAYAALIPVISTVEWDETILETIDADEWGEATYTNGSLSLKAVDGHAYYVDGEEHFLFDGSNSEKSFVFSCTSANILCVEITVSEKHQHNELSCAWQETATGYRWVGEATSVDLASTIFKVTGIRFSLGEAFPEPTPTPAQDGDKLPGAFSVDGSKVVYFSKGNLQYLGNIDRWHFAENQWTIIGNAQASDNRDLFSWGTGDNPDSDDYSTYTEWGNNIEGNWRTLTVEEWTYLFNTRTGASSKYGTATVAGVVGLILLPDVYDGTAINTERTAWDNNVISSSEWAAYEAAGAVFLPTAGLSDSYGVYGVGEQGFYWSSTMDALTHYAVSVFYGFDAFEGYWFNQVDAQFQPQEGHSVRLVSETAPSGGSSEPTDQDLADAVIALINAIPNPVVYTQACKDKIDAARAAYDALNDDQKDLVNNYVVLLNAETTYPQLAPNPSGECGAEGDNLLWSLNSSTGVLTITGSGAMADWPSDTQRPWYAIITQITSVELPSGITSIGTKAFRGCTSLASINMAENYPASLTTIKQEVFCHTGLTSVTIPESVVTIGQDAFYLSQGITDVYCYADPNNLTWNDYYKDDFNKSPAKSTQCHVKNCHLDVFNTNWNTGNSTDVNVTFVGDLPGECGGSTPEPEPEDDGKLTGAFTINADGDQILFSKGNLQYHCTNHVWQFATNQFNMIGADNANISDTYDGWIDLFGWGTGNCPTKTSTVDEDYSTFVDWGANDISNGGNEANLWRTLTRYEWAYLIQTRANAADLKGQATVADVYGYVLLPDSWTLPAGLSFTASPNNWTTNVYTAEQWTQMEAAGAVFLPATGYRDPEIKGVGTRGEYWSADRFTDLAAYDFEFNETTSKVFGSRIYFGHPVRLVTAAPTVPTPTPTDEQVPTNEDPENPSYHYSTFFHGTQNYALTNDGTVAFVADLSGNDLVLTKIAEGTQVIPANTAVILRKTGSADPVVLTPTEENGVSFSANNDLLGVDAETAAPANCYVLSGTDQYGVGFYQILGNTLKAHKAYVIYTGSAAPKRMRFVFNQTTDVENANAEMKAEKRIENGQVIIIRNGVKYNVSGQIVR